MNSNDKISGPLSGLIGLLLMDAARQGGVVEPPTLEEMLSGRQKGTRINPRASFMGQLIAGFSPDELPEEARVQMRKDIVSGELKPTPGCDCPVCAWVLKQPEWLRPNEAAPDAATVGAAEEFVPPEFVEAAKTVPDILREAAATYEERNPLYGDAYKTYGPIMMGFFPQGIYINEPEDWNRFGLFSMMVSKMARIANNITVGGHYDSALDLSVYAAMAAELTEKK